MPCVHKSPWKQGNSEQRPQRNVDAFFLNKIYNSLLCSATVCLICLCHSLRCCICQKKRDEAFLLHCEAQALCWKCFSCVFQQETQFCVRGYTWLRSAVCVISLWLRSQLPHTFPGFFGEDPKCISNPPEATWLEDRHLPLHPDRFPTPHPVCQSYQMKTNGYIHPYPRPYHCPALQSGPSLLPELLHPVAAPSSSPLY